MPFDATIVTHIFLDADDTLWINEKNYRDTEKKCFELLAEKLNQHEAAEQFFEMQLKNLHTFGYGAKSFLLSMLELTLYTLPEEKAPAAAREIIELGKKLIELPVVLLPRVKETLEHLAGKYPLTVITKGDLLDQERKLKKSGLLPLLNHVEIVSEKSPTVYREIFARLNIKPTQALMVGNTLKSDVLPAIEAGAQAALVPCDCNWKHEWVEGPIKAEYLSLPNGLPDLLDVLL